ncbi:uncharacterized protein Y057_14554 [Fusarium fujikuroi]|nr:uncharacterized protein Y057_14554 [Fusarium fujikuroi]
MASTTSYSQGESPQRAPHRRANVGWLSPCTSFPNLTSHLINASSDPTAKSNHQQQLRPCAYKRGTHFYQQIASGQLNPGDISAQRLALNDLEDPQTIISQIQDINTGRFVFSSLYLKERHILYYWGRAISFLSQNLLAADEIHQPSLWNLKRITEYASDMESAVLDAGWAGVLTSDYRLVLSERWDLFESAFNLYHQHSQSPRTVAKWPNVARRAQAAPKVVPQDSKTGLPTQSGVWVYLDHLRYPFVGRYSIAETDLGASHVASIDLHDHSTTAISHSSDGVVELRWSCSYRHTGIDGSTACDSFRMSGGPVVVRLVGVGWMSCGCLAGQGLESTLTQHCEIKYSLIYARILIDIAKSQYKINSPDCLVPYPDYTAQGR